MNSREQIEHSIIKKYRRTLWSRFTTAVRDYELISEGDRIAVCISGGKDSMLLAKCIQELCRHSPVRFEAEYIVMDPGYRDENRALIEDNLSLLGIPAHIFDSPIFESVHHIDSSPCYVCARMRRGYLYRYAADLGCNKIALGHHYDDVIETTLMSILYAGQVRSMMPKLRSTNFPGMELIRPLYHVREEDIIAWQQFNGLHFLRCACKFTEEAQKEEIDSKRKDTKELIRRLRDENPFVEANLFRATQNVHLDTVREYTEGGKRISFKEHYARLRPDASEED